MRRCFLSSDKRDPNTSPSCLVSVEVSIARFHGGDHSRARHLKSYLCNSRVQRSTGNDGVSKDSCDFVLDGGQGRLAQLRRARLAKTLPIVPFPPPPSPPAGEQCHEDDNCYARLRESADNRKSVHVGATSSRSAAYKSATPRQPEHQSTIYESNSLTKPPSSTQPT